MRGSMKYIYLILKTLIICLFFDFGVSQSFQADNARLQKALKQSGISVEDAKKMIGNDQGNNILEEVIDNEENNSSKEVKEQVSNIRTLNKSISVLDDSLSNLIDRTNTQKKSENSKNLLNPDALTAVKNKISEDVLKNIDEEKKKDQISDIKDNYYGYNVFDGKPDVFQSSIAESIDPNYLIGPGDEIIIMLWGETEINKTYTVSRDGYVFIPNVGQVFVNSYTLEKLEKKLFKLLKKAYSSLDPVNGNATTFFDVSLGSLSLQPLRVFVLGEVKKPGAYIMKTSATLFTSLYYFGGPEISGSLRDVQLIRKEKKIASVDFYDYLLTGIREGDMSLQRDDVIFIPPRGKTVTTRGEINKKLIFELKDGDQIHDLIRYAGGLKPTTYVKRASINRILPAEIRLKDKINRTVIDIDLSNIKKSTTSDELFDSDVVEFFRIDGQRKNIVTIKGHVTRPGVYDLGKGLKLLDLIIKADSLKTNAFLNRADIVRVQEGQVDKNLIKVNLGDIIFGDPKDNIDLQSNDIVTIYNLSRMSYSTNVSIIGHVKNPGIKEYYKGMDVYDLVFLGGGFENQKHLKNTYLSKADLLKKDENNKVYDMTSFRLDSVLIGRGIANRKIEMGDEIKIYSVSDMLTELKWEVTINGLVKRPGVYPITKNTMLSEILFRAGGLEDDNFKKDIFMERLDIIRKSDFQSPPEIISINLKNLMDATRDYDIKLEMEDKIRVYSNKMFFKDDSVSIRGEVINPQKYAMSKNMSLSDLILESGGFVGNESSYRIEISRLNNKVNGGQKDVTIKTIDYKTDQKFFINSKIKTVKEMVLRDGDEIVVRVHPDADGFQYVNIEGEILYPGKYTIESKNEMVSSLIKRAGGLTPDAFPMASTLKRNNEEVRLSFEKLIKNPRSSSNFSIMNGDSLIIGSKSNLVKIVGEVNTPGNYQYFKNKNIQDYISLAGGLTDIADRKKIFVEYSDGSSKKQKNFLFSPAIKDGSIIYVGQKEDMEPFDLTTYVTNLTTLWTDITQAYLLILLTFRTNTAN